MGNQKDLAEEIKQTTAQLQKVGNESAKLQQKISDLEAVINNQSEVTPELRAAVDELKTQAKIVDDMVPDAQTGDTGAGSGEASTSTGEISEGPTLGSPEVGGDNSKIE